MNITQFIKYLNKSRNWQIQGSYYTHIEEWKNWWRGWYEPFHLIREQKFDGTLCGREMYRMKMPKRACEDWASLLLNDKTTVTVEDAASSVWLMGEDQEQTGGQLGKLEFWPNANALVELAFRSGTGAFVLSVEKILVQSGKAVPSPDAEMTLDYLPAECILPLTVRHGKIIDVAFASEVIVNGKSCIYLQTHRLQKDGYHIQNEYFASKSENSESADYQPAPLPEGMAASFVTGSAVTWFAVFSPNIVKTLPEGPGLGMSIFAEALDQAKQCDLAFDNYCRDIFLGGKKVFYSQNLMKTSVDHDGNTIYTPPDDIRQQLFIQTFRRDKCQMILTILTAYSFMNNITVYYHILFWVNFDITQFIIYIKQLKCQLSLRNIQDFDIIMQMQHTALIINKSCPLTVRTYIFISNIFILPFHIATPI